MFPRDLARPKSAATSYVVYLGDRELTIDGTRVLPVATFLRRLWAGKIIG